MKKNVFPLLAGSLLLLGSLVLYGLRIEQCYQPQSLPLDPAALAAFRSACRFEEPIVHQFSAFLWLFLPGLGLFTAYWLGRRPIVHHHRSGTLSMFLAVMLLDSLIMILYGFLGYPVPAQSGAPAGWAVLTVAGLGLLMYLSILALWHWKRWGLALFQGSAIALAIFILLAGGSMVLSAVIVGGVLLLSLLFRSVRQYMA